MRRQSWTQRYLGQLTLYELASNFERGWFLLVNKANLYEYRWIELPLDYCRAEALLQKASRVNAHLEQGSLPPKLNDPIECRWCPFAYLCGPDHKTGGNLTVIGNPQLEEVLDRLEELEETRQEIGALERQRDKILEDCKGQDVVSGRWMITWTKKEGVTPPKAGDPVGAVVQGDSADCISRVAQVMEKTGCDTGRSWAVVPRRPDAGDGPDLPVGGGLCLA